MGIDPEGIPKGEEDWQAWMETEAQISINMSNVNLLSAGQPLADVISKVNEILSIRNSS